MIAPLSILDRFPPATMSIAEARLILGPEADGLSDGELVDILRAMDAAAAIAIESTVCHASLHGRTPAQGGWNG